MFPQLVVGMALTALTLTARPRPRTVRIALVSDPHVTCAESGAAAAYRRNFEQAIAEVNAARVDLVLFAGDLTDAGDAASFARFRELIRSLRSPVRWAPGNHDCGGKVSAGAEGAVTESKLAAYERVLGRSYGVETVAGVRLVRVNASLLGSGLPSEARQWAMLEREAGSPAPAMRLILLHYPLFLENPDETDGGYWTVDPGARGRLLALAEKMSARAILFGHLHRRLEKSWSGIAFIGAPAVSFGLPEGKEPPGWALLTVSPDGQVQVEWRPLKDRPAQAAATMKPGGDR